MNELHSNTKRSCFLFILGVIIVFVSCRKKEEKPKTEYLGFVSLGEAKDYLLFKPGTWWVYKNTYTNELDTMILIESVLDTAHIEKDMRVADYETVSLFVKSLRDKATYWTYCNWMAPSVLDLNPFWYFSCWRQGGYYDSFESSHETWKSGHFFYPFSHPGVYNGGFGTSFTGYKDSINFKGKTYNDIVSFFVYQDDSYPYPNKYLRRYGDSRYYWARNFGMVKMEHESWDAPVNGNKVFMNWELIECKIIK